MCGPGSGDAAAAGAVPVPGTGAVSRGRGDARMIWGDESPDLAQELARALPAAEYRNLDDTAVLGVGRTAPRVAPSAEGGGLVDGDASVGRAAWRRRLSPRHRDAVRSFFGDDR